MTLAESEETEDEEEDDERQEGGPVKYDKTYLLFLLAIHERKYFVRTISSDL